MSRTYQRTQHHALSFSTTGLDTQLLRLAHQRRLPDLQALYTAVGQGRLAARALARALLVPELVAALIVTVNGEATPYPRERIRLCAVCQPGPRNAIYGDEQHTATGSILTVHRQPLRPCPTHGQLKVMSWAKQRKARETIIAVSAGSAQTLVAALVVRATGEATPYPRERIRLCAVCQPGPRNAIYGDEQHTATGSILTVHCQIHEPEAPAGQGEQRGAQPNARQGPPRILMCCGHARNDHCGVCGQCPDAGGSPGGEGHRRGHPLPARAHPPVRGLSARPQKRHLRRRTTHGDGLRLDGASLA